MNTHGDQSKELEIPGGYKVLTTQKVCGCIETTILSPDGKVYRQSKMMCSRHGGEKQEPLPGQLDLFTGANSAPIKKKKAGKQ